MARAFDLNIERILDHWKPHHAVRELIANALDETKISSCAPPEIKKAGNSWIIRDFGRGLHYGHLTQKVSEEKKRIAGVIGYFGIGLKDALGALHRAGVEVELRSRHGTITLADAAKHGFADVRTLHAEIAEPTAGVEDGTEVRLTKIADAEIAKAKEMFLVFNNEPVVESTKHGQVLRRDSRAHASIYVNGLRIAREEDFLFSYNVTSVTESMRKALNRERANVGREAYSSRVKEILLASKATAVADALATALEEFEEVGMSGELQWLDVQQHAVSVLNASGTAVFLTPEEIALNPRFVDEARSGKNRIVTIPEKLRDKIAGGEDINGNPIRDLDEFVDEYERSFHYEFVAVDALSSAERRVFETWPALMQLAEVDARVVAEVCVSKTMRIESVTERDALGVWQDGPRRIIIRRDQLRSERDFAATFIHELAHAVSGADDITLDFEDRLTSLLGVLATKVDRAPAGLLRGVTDRLASSLRARKSAPTRRKKH